MASLIVVLILEIAGVITIEDAIANALLFLLALIIIAILAGVGGMFVGIFFTNRMISGQDFTPFEREMLAMRQDIKEIREKIGTLVNSLQDSSPRK